MWVALRNVPSGAHNFIDIYDVTNQVELFGSRQNDLSTGGGNFDIVLRAATVSQGQSYAPNPGPYQVRLIIGDSFVGASVPFNIIPYVEPPFPGLNTVIGISVFYPSISPVLAGSSVAAAIQGTVTIAGGWQNDLGGHNPQNVTIQFLLNDTIPIGPPILQSGSNPITQTWNTASGPYAVADGTYSLGCKIVDCNDVYSSYLGGKWNAYQLVAFPKQIVVANTLPIVVTPPVQIPTFYPYENNHAVPATVDYVTYKGVPQPAAPYPYPGPGQSVVFSPPAYGSNGLAYQSNPALLRDISKFYYECITENRYFEYQAAPQFWRTRLGGVFSGGWSAKNGATNSIEGSYATIVRTSFRDGGRNSNMLTSIANFIATDQGLGLTPVFSAHWTAVQADGRVFTIDLDGTVTTIAGPTRDLTQLPFDWQDGTTPEFTNDKIIGTIAPSPLDFGDFGGINDVCWDPRNPNILYAAKTLDQFIMKIDFTPNPPYGPSNPLCSRYAGYDAGVLGDGHGGYVDGAAIGQAQFNGPYSICMQKVPGIPGHPVGTMYVADNYNCLIRVISADGSTVSTLCGAHPTANPSVTPPPDAHKVGINSVFVSTVQSSSTYTVASITQNGDGVTAAVVMASPTPITGDGWKLTIQVNGTNYGDSDGSNLEHGYGIYTVSSFTDSQHFSVTMKPVPASGSTLTAIIYAMDTYSSPTAIPLSQAYTAYPQTVRLSSTGDIVLGEAYYNQMLRRIWLTGAHAGNITRIGPFGNLAIAASLAWGWHDVDDRGACGPVDDIKCLKADTNPGSASLIWHWSIDGSYNGTGGGTAGSFFPEGVGYGGHYPWAFAYSKTQARCLSIGESDTGVFSWRPIRPGVDPDLSFDSVIGNNGLTQWEMGTVYPFPFNLRPSFMALYGQQGTHHFGQNVLPTLDDIQTLYPTDYNTTGSQTGTLTGFIQSGAGGSFPRPEYAVDDSLFDGQPVVPGRDLQGLLYFMRRASLKGTYPTEAVPGPGSLNFIRPVVSGVSATRLSNTSIRVSWTTDVPTIGLAAGGSPYSQSPSWVGPYPYNIWSPLETGYGTSHTVTITGLPDVSVTGNGPTHYAVLSKDKAGNWGRSPDAVVS